MAYRLVSGVLFLLICGLTFVFFPKLILAASGMEALKDEAIFCWSVRAMGLVFVSIASWFVYAALQH